MGGIIEMRSGQVSEQDGTLLGGGGCQFGQRRPEPGRGGGTVAGGEGTVPGEAVQAGRVVEVEPVRYSLVGGDGGFREVEPSVVAGPFGGSGDGLGGDAVQPRSDERGDAVPARPGGRVGQSR